LQFHSLDPKGQHKIFGAYAVENEGSLANLDRASGAIEIECEIQFNVRSSAHVFTQSCMPSAHFRTSRDNFHAGIATSYYRFATPSELPQRIASRFPVAPEVTPVFLIS
jgi:hypothetical protein